MSTADTSQKLSPEDLRELEELHASFTEQAPANAAEQVSFEQVAVKVQAVKQLLLTLQKQQKQLAKLLDILQLRKKLYTYGDEKRVDEELKSIAELKQQLVVMRGELRTQVDNEVLKASITKLKIQIAAAEEKIVALNPSIAEVRDQISETKSSIRDLGIDV